MYMGTGNIQDGVVPVNQAVLPRYAPISGCGCSAVSAFGAIESDQYNKATWGHVAMGTAGGIMLGVLFGFAWWRGPKH